METQSSSKGHAGIMRGAAVSSIAVMGSRVMGLLREQIFAYFFGASREYDAFLTAFRIPNLLRDLLAEGALSSAFITIFSKDCQKLGTRHAFRVANYVINALALLLIVLVAMGIWFAPSIVHVIAVGFDPAKAALAAQLTQIMFPFILFVALSAVAMGMLNAQEHYGLPQSASTFFNLVSIFGGLSCAYLFAPDYMQTLWQHGVMQAHASGQASRAMMGMAVGTLLGGATQLFIQIPTLMRLGYRWRPVVDWHDPSFRAVLRLMGPAVIGAAAVQVNVFVNSNFASLLGDRPISWLNYAFRLMQFPIGVFGVAVMTAALPALSRHIAAEDFSGFGTTLTRAMELVWALTLPATVGLAVLGEPIIRLIYEHGRFDHADTVATAAALAAYALGLPAYAAMKIVQPAYVAMGDARTPMYTSMIAVVFNAAMNFFFVKILQIGHAGLALSTSLMSVTNVSVLILLLEWRTPTLERRELGKQLLLTLIASAWMGGVGYAVYRFLQTEGLSAGGRGAILELGLAIPLCVVNYFVAARVLKLSALNAIVGIFKRRLGKSA